MATRAVFDAGVPVESLPWGDDVREFAFERGTMPSTPGASSSTPMYVATPRARAPRGIIIVCHTAIGPWETFIRSCCDGSRAADSIAAAPDLYGLSARASRRGDEARETRRGRESREFRRVEGSGRGSSGSSVDGIDVGGVDEVRGGGLLSRRTSRRGTSRGASPSDDVGDAVAVASFHGVLDECALPGRAMRACRVHVYHGTADPFTSAEALERCERDLAERGATRASRCSRSRARGTRLRVQKR